MDVKMYKLMITFLTPVLGTQPTKDVATKFITSKAADPETGELPADELETLPEALEKGTTAFHRLPNGTPLYYDYMVKGFLKEAGMIFNGMRNGSNPTSPQVKNLRSKIDNIVFVQPRQIVLQLPATMWVPGSGVYAENGTYTFDPLIEDWYNTEARIAKGYIEVPTALTYLERPLRAMTAQGPRTTLARSEMLPDGTWFACTIKVYKEEVTKYLLEQLLDYGGDKGLGQWRNGGYGKFNYLLEEMVL